MSPARATSVSDVDAVRRNIDMLKMSDSPRHANRSYRPADTHAALAEEPLRCARRRTSACGHPEYYEHAVRRFHPS